MKSVAKPKPRDKAATPSLGVKQSSLLAFFKPSPASAATQQTLSSSSGSPDMPASVAAAGYVRGLHLLLAWRLVVWYPDLSCMGEAP